MGWLDEYYKALDKKKKEEPKDSWMDSYHSELSKLTAEQERTSPRRVVGTTASDNTPLFLKEKKESIFDGWFKKSEADSVSGAILGSGTDVLSDIGTGILGIGEKALDAFASLAPYAANAQFYQNGVFDLETEKAHKEAIEQSKKDIGEWVKKDLYDEEAVAKQLLSHLGASYDMTQKLQNGGIATEEDWKRYKQMQGDAAKYLDEDMEAHSVFDEKTDSLVQSAGQLAGTAALSAMGIPADVVIGLSSYGGEMENALKQGATYDEASFSSAVSAGAEILTEKISGGIKFGGKTLDDLGTKWLARNISNKALRTAANMGMQVIGEGAEEVASGFLSAGGQKLSYMDEKELSELFTKEDAWESFIGGAALGMGGSTIQTVNSAVNGVDSVTELTKNEQKVVDKVYKDELAKAEKNGKITERQKAKIYDEVLEDMEKGYISTDTIEEVLGGERYEQYRKASEWEESLKQEFEELGKKENPTLADQRRFSELDKQLENVKATSTLEQMKAQLNKDVYEMTKGDRLVESYFENVRSKQKFEADLTKYEGKARDIIQKVMESGLADNSNQTHEFWDMAAQIATDRDADISIANDEQILELVKKEYEAEGKTFDASQFKGKRIDGYASKNGIVLNAQTKRALNFVLGHEITHTLEQSNHYKDLQKILFDYAKDEYRSRYNERAGQYKDIYTDEGYKAKMDKEVTADMVGDILFSDKDFVKHLSTENRNVFQKVWDEIKYFCKVATAGSKEARQLEKLKKTFEDAYREAGKAQGDGKYSISETTDGRSVAVVDNDILSHIDTSNWDKGTKSEAKKAANEALRAFSDGFSINGIEYVGNKKSRDEYIRSDYSEALARKNPETYLDKMRAASVLDDVVRVATDWKNDGYLKYDRPDYVDFIRGKTLIKSGDHTYSAVVLAGIKENGEAVFHDVEDIYPESFEIKESEPSTAVATNKSPNAILESSDGVNLAQNGNDVKLSLSDSDGKELTKEQQDYFKDSKMRDENGNLKVMYHGSQDAGFHTFDAKMSDDDTSFFFVDRNDVAATYSGTSETYEAKTIRTAEDMNNFLAEIGYDQYEAVEQDGKFVLLEDGDHVATKDTAQEIYEEFCWYEGVGNGDANYKVYLNLKNPLEVDAQGRNWDNVSRDFSQEVADRYHSLTAEEKAALHDLAGWGEMSIFRDAKRNPTDDVVASAFEKLGDANIYDMFSIAEDNFSDLAIEAWAVKQMNTRDYSQKAKAEGYDGVIFKNIHDNGGYSNGSEGASTVAIAFDSNQIKSVANETPTADPDIRYSVSEADNQKGLDSKREIEYSISYDTDFSDRAIAKNNESRLADQSALNAAKLLRKKIADRMTEIKDRGLVGLPEDREGNTYIANSSYDGTEENTTICPRSLASEAFVDAVSEYLGRPLTVEEQIYISQDLQGRSLTPECTYCYVATDRKAYRAFLGEYIKQRDAVLQKVQANPNADLSENGELYKEFLNGRKPTKPMYKRFKMWVDAYMKGRPMVDASHLANINKLMGDISEFGEELKPQIVDAMKYAQSASWAKKRVNYVAYNGHILNWKQDRINKLNSHYGLRMYSFSDFHPAFVLENMQMITDASVRGLKMLGYTKDTDFVDIFAPSGMNINVSTFGFESGGNVFENNIIGAEWEKAKALREQFPNVGITFVATNDTLVNWALDQDWIDVVIPYHLVRTGAEVAKAFGYTNYTSESADTKTKEWQKGDKKYIAPTEHNNDKATYLAALEKNHLKPRFERFIDNPNYMKLVNECRLPASQSNPVQPVFNEDAAMVALAKLEANGYYQPIGGSVDRMYEIAAEVAENMKQELAPAMSISDEGQIHREYGRWNVYSKYVAPVAENSTQQTETQLAEGNSTVTEGVADMFPDNLAPVQDEIERLEAERNEIYGGLETALEHGSDTEVGELAAEYDAITARIRELEAEENQRTDSLTDADVPAETEAPMSMRSENHDPFRGVTIDEISRSTRSYSDLNPGARHFFEEAALGFLYDVNNSTHGERWYNDQLYYESGGEQGFGGTSRHTTDDIADLKDTYGYTWDELRTAAQKVADGDFRSVAAKRVEYLIHKRMMEGYTDVDGRRYEPNQDYISFLNETFANEQRTAGVDNLLANAPEDIAPVKPLAKATPDTMTAPLYDSKDRTAVKGQQSMFEPPKPNPKVATVLTEESAIAKEKSGIGMKLTSALVDKGMVFENLSLKTGNHELQAKWNYALPSNTEARAQYTMEHGASGVKSLKDIQKAVDKSGKADDFSNYLYHVHNIDRMTLEDRFDVENKTVFGETVTADVSRRKVAQYEKTNPMFKDWAEDVYAYNRHLRQLLVEGNVISQDTADLWEKRYPHYVPIRRVDAKGQNISVPLDTNKTGVHNPIKKATGGNSDIQPVFATMAQRTEQTYRAIARNAFGIELKNTLGSTLTSQKNSTGVDETIDMLVAQEDHLLKPGTQNSNPTFTVFEDGERVEFEITEDMLDALKPAGKLLGYRNKAVGKVSEVRRNMLTTWNPVFALYRNPIKDMQDVAVNSQHAVKTYLNVPNAIYQIATGGKYAQEYHQNGGKSNTYFDSRSNEFKKEDNIFKKTIGMPIRAIETAGEFIEEIPRLAEYIASRQEGRSVERSMLDAARVTTNFAAGGDFTKLLNSHGFTFLNASVQGASQHVRNIREAKQQGLKGWTKLVAKYTIAGLPTILLNGMLWDDDEEYEELSDYVKQNYYVVAKTEDGKFVRIPKGRTAAVMGELMNQMQNLVTGDDEADFGTFYELFWNNIAPNNPVENNIVAPILQVMNNKAWYGDELVPSRLQKLPDVEQFDESTDSISKWLGEKTNTSPYKWNYLLDQYSGGLGDAFLPMITPEAESGDNTFLGNMLAPWKKEITTDKVLNNKNPGDFYDLKDELEKLSNSRNATEEDSMRSMYMDSVSWEMGDLYAQKREIQSGDLSDSEKYEKVRELQEQINELAKTAMEGYNDVSIDGLYSEVGDRRYNKDAESGKWYEIREKNSDGSANYYYQKEQNVTKALGISYGEYWNNREEYDYAYDKPEQYALAQAVGGYDSYRSHTSELWDIKADKDENGKSINGSRKDKVIEYLNELDIDYYHKIILFKNEYNADDTYNEEIIEYLNGRDDISYQQMESILKYLGFDVDSEGNISWD